MALYLEVRKISLLVVTFLCLARSAGANPTFTGPLTNGTVNVAGLSEASGVQASRNNPEVIWTHNDSGHPAEVFALDTQGRLLGTYTLPGNTDNEDIAMGPGPVTNVLYLYVGDIGDNGASRANIKIYQIPEPAVYGRQYTNPITATPKGTRTITLTYPDGARDAESMFVDPITGDLFILSKESTSRIYTAPKSQLDTNSSFALTFVRSLAFTTPSAADISPLGNEIIVRRESAASLWLRNPGDSISNAFNGTAITIPVTGTANGEPNGEAIGFDAMGSGYFTLSDDAITQPLRYFARASDDGPPPPPVELVSAGSTWKYLADGSNQGAAWRTGNVNDSVWPSGVGQFGYGDGDEQTVLSYGPNPSNKYITTYFRKFFVAENAADVTNLILKLVVDDGAAVYLNGTLAMADNLSSNAAYNTLAMPMTTALQSTWHTYHVASRLLAEGTNLLAVELHQSSLAGTNVSFDLQLLAEGRGTAYEPFSYSVGSSLVLLTNAGGQWWTSAGTGAPPANVTAGNLAVPGLATSSGASMQFGAVDGPSARFNLPANVTNGTCWFSFAFKVTSLGTLSASGSWFAGLNNSRGSQTTTPITIAPRLLARASGPGGFNLGVAKNSTKPSDWLWATNNFSPGETIVLVGNYSFNSPNDAVNLWLNPNPADFAAASPPTATLTTTNGTNIVSSLIASFVFLQRGLNNTNQPATAIADELRIGSSWAAVTPPGAPLLSAGRNSARVLLSWPTNAPGFTLESTRTLAPTSAWSQVPAPILLSNRTYFVTNSITSTNTFYRLRY